MAAMGTHKGGGLRNYRPGPRWGTLEAIFSAVALAIGIVAATAPELLMLLAGAALVSALIPKALGRLCLTVGGGLLVLQSSESLNASKLAYLGVLAICIAAAAIRAPTLLREDWAAPLVPTVKVSIGYALYLGMTSFVAITHGVRSELWLRDILPYALLAAAPVLALDAASTITRKGASNFVVIIGIVAPLGFAADWLSRRGVSSLPVGRVVLASIALCVVPFAYFLVLPMLRVKRARWLFLPAGIFAVLVATGTRSSFVLLAGFLGIIGSRRKVRVDAMRAASMLIIGCGLVALVVPIIVRATVNDDNFLRQRVDSTLGFLNGGQDQSAVYRASAYAYSAKVFRQNPILGVGPGGILRSADQNLDTPLAIPAKFGIIGSTVLLGFLGSICAAFFRARRQSGWSVVQTTARVTFMVFVAAIPFGALVEDKGFVFSVLLLMVLLCVDLRTGTGSAVSTRSEAPSHPSELLMNDRGSVLPRLVTLGPRQTGSRA